MLKTSEKTNQELIDIFLKDYLVKSGLEVRPMDDDNKWLVIDNEGQDISISLVVVFVRDLGRRFSIVFEQIINYPEVKLSQVILYLFSEFYNKYIVPELNFSKEQCENE